MGFVFEDVAAALVDDPACVKFRQPDSAVLLWDRSGERLLWSSASAAWLRQSFAVDDEGRPEPGLPALERLQALGRGLAPRRGIRIERLWFDVNRLAPPVTCGCRIIALPSGEEILLTAPVEQTFILTSGQLLGPPKSAEKVGDDVVVSDSAIAQRFTSGRSEMPEPSAIEDASVRPHRGTVRFTWQADPATRFSAVSPALSEIVGPESAAIIGRTWTEIASECVVDPSDAVANLFAKSETWGRQLIYWRIGESDHAVAVDLAGMPVFGPERQFLGFSGFGLCRTDTIILWPRTDPSNSVDRLNGGSVGLVGGLGSHDPEASQSIECAGSPKMVELVSNPSTGGQPLPEDTAGGQTASSLDQDRAPPPFITESVPHDESSPLGNSESLAASQQTSFVSLNGTVAAHLGQDRPAPLRAVEEASSKRSEVSGSTGLAENQTMRVGSEPRPRLSIAERSAFREIARALGARFAGDDSPEMIEEPKRSADVHTVHRLESTSLDAARILDRIPIGILVHRGGQPIFANRLLLGWIGYSDVEKLAVDGGVARLFRGQPQGTARSEEGAPPLALSTRQGRSLAVEARLTTVEWGDAPAGLMLIRKIPDADPALRIRAIELELEAREARVQELSAILDTATDGVLVLDHSGRILALNRSAEALFGYDQKEVTGEPVTVLLAPESHAAAIEYLSGLQENGVASLLNDGREVLGRVRQGGVIPLFMTLGRVSEGPEPKFCSVLRDITAYKKAEGELRAAKNVAEHVSAQRSDLLAKINHEIRTPLNAVIGFAEVMLEERFGPVGNERYKDYLDGVRASGRRVVNLVDDLLNLAKIEAGEAELSFAGLNLNAVVVNCMALMQPQAARERIVMRTSFAPRQPSIVADERSVRQIVLNIVSNAIRFTDAGGQVIVSTAATDRGEVALRVRDTGIGMTSGEIEAALKPFGQLATARRGDGTGLSLPLTKALVAANRGTLQITSVRDEGTLVEVLFPSARVLAQ